jgi:hypothetical protein
MDRANATRTFDHIASQLQEIHAQNTICINQVNKVLQKMMAKECYAQNILQKQMMVKEDRNVFATFNDLVNNLHKVHVQNGLDIDHVKNVLDELTESHSSMNNKPLHNPTSLKSMLKFEVACAPELQTFEDVASHLHEIFAYDTVNIDYVQKVLEKFSPCRKEWQKYAIYDRYK